MVMSKFRLDGKVAIVTGVGVMNGKHIALALAEAGADVCLVARSRPVIEQTAVEIRTMGRRALPLTADVTDSGQVDRMVAEARSKLGRIDILFNHVGGGGRPGPILNLSDEDWHACFLGNLYSMFYCTRAVGKVMVEQKQGGSIINTSSVASSWTPPGLTPYSVAKAGVNQFTRCMAVELGPHGIRVNCIMLGAFENAGPKIDPALAESIVKTTPLGRFGKRDESAPAALYLASEASSFVTGVIIRVSGGRVLFGG